MKLDEWVLLRILAAFPPGGAWPRTIGRQLGIPPRRTNYLLGKWGRKEWYDYGVCIDMGWLTKAGYEAAAATPPPRPLSREEGL